MIGSVTGTVAVRGADHCLIDVGGVGYRLTCSATTLRTLPPMGSEARLWTHVHVREDALALFGFATEHEQTMFEALITVPGVGPKVALQVCSAFAPDAFRRALVTEDIPAISSVPGIGKKTASRIVLDLKEKLDLPDLALVGNGTAAVHKARSALENLGYSPAEVRAALSETEHGDEVAVEDLIKAALKALA